jgi:hypothetical protein
MSTTTDYFSIFGNVLDGTIQNVTTQGSITVDASVAALAGTTRNTKFINCTNTAAITAVNTKANAAGIAGITKNTEFINCTNAAAITAGNVATGIAVNLGEGGVISKCRNSGAITGQTGSAGGICSGIMLATVKDSVNTGAVNSIYRAGGIASSSSGSTIIACKNTGAVTLTGPKDYYWAGGVIGSVSSSPGPGAITACYNTGTVSASGTKTSGGYVRIGGITGTNSGGGLVINACYNTGDVVDTTTGDDSVPVYLGAVSGFSAYTAADTPSNPVITACFWKAGTGTRGLAAKQTAETTTQTAGPPEGEDGTLQFASDAWPKVSTHADWGTGDGSGSGKYWKSLGVWNSGVPVYPKLWFED